mgnify:CR=1 FL=1|jgi:hypothetical protein
MDEFYKEIKKEIEKYPHSPARVPYTYHHDYIRSNVFPGKSMSRSEVANLTKYSPDELYATALMYILSNITMLESIEKGISFNKTVYNKALKIFNQHISNLKSIVENEEKINS